MGQLSQVTISWSYLEPALSRVLSWSKALVLALLAALTLTSAPNLLPFQCTR